jgi:hypothetical protein
MTTPPKKPVSAFDDDDINPEIKAVVDDVQLQRTNDIAKEQAAAAGRRFQLWVGAGLAFAVLAAARLFGVI